MTIDHRKGDNVISITPKRRQIRFPALGRVEAYWDGVRNGRVMPVRGEIDPRGIADVLEFAFVLEKVAPGVARLRLAGMHLNDLMAMEVRGMPLSALFMPEARAEIQRVLEDVLDGPAVVRLTLATDSGLGRPPLEAQMILMPLRDDHGRPSRVLGALQSRGEIGRGPRRFTIRDIETKAIFADPLSERRPDRADPAPETEPGATAETNSEELARRLAERQAARRRAQDEHEPRPSDKAPHLRLVFDADTV